MRFRSVERGTFAEYPLTPYSTDMYSGGYAGLFTTSYYADSGGYGWKYDEGDKSLTLVYAPGGGLQMVYRPSDAKYASVYASVVAGKSPVSKGTMRKLAEAAGGKATTPFGGSSAVPSWMLPAAAVLVLAGVVALAFWPTGKKS